MTGCGDNGRKEKGFKGDPVYLAKTEGFPGLWDFSVLKLDNPGLLWLQK